MKVFICVFVLSAGVAAFYLSDFEFTAFLPESAPPIAQSPQKIEPGLPPPNLQALATGLNVAANPEEESESNPIIELQVQSASEELKSSDIDTRIGAIEQLAAYPNQESERLIVNILQTDSDETLRSTAANALSALRNPGRETLSVLTVAAADPSEAVRQSALMTLEIYVNREPYGSSRTKIILQELGQRLKRRNLSGSARKELLEFIGEYKS